MYISYCTLLRLLILLVCGLKRVLSYEDVCGMGTKGIQMKTINVNFTYQGIDTSNSNMPYWISDCQNVTLEYGVKYGGSARYYLKIKPAILRWYGYCSELDTLPTDCSSWYLYDGSTTAIDTAYSVKNCSYYMDRSDCMNSTYLSLANIEATDSYCISDGTVKSDLNGVYDWSGSCDEGFPYYTHESTSSYNIHFDWCFGWWLIGADVSSISVSGYCQSSDFSECNGILIVYDGSSFVYDTGATIDTFCDPTNAPTDIPSSTPTAAPTVPPSDTPTNEPSFSPSDYPSYPPSNAPSMSPTAAPTGADEDGLTSFLSGAGSTVYMLLGFGITLLICWIICCFWYVRRRNQSMAAKSGENNNEAASAAGGVGSQTDDAPGATMASTMASTTPFGTNGIQMTTTQQNASNGEGTQGTQGTQGTTSAFGQQMYNQQQQQYQQQFMAMQNTLRMQQMQHQNMLQKQMQMLQNATMMPQPQINQGNMAFAQNQQFNQMIQSVDSPHSTSGGLNGGGFFQATPNGQVPNGQVANGANGANYINYNNLPTNGAAYAFTNGVAQAYVDNPGGPGNGGEKAEDSDTSNDDLFVNQTSSGGPGQAPMPPQFHD